MRQSEKGGDEMSEARRGAAGVSIDFALMPDYVKTDIAATVWNAVKDFMSRPDADAILKATRERLIREGSTLLDPRPKLKGAKS